MIPKVQQLISIFWPSFIMAGLGSILFFVVIDPMEMVGSSWFANLDRLGVYTVGFLFFWLLTACSCMLTCYFQKPEDRICSTKT